ncbi:MAG: SBBP repeat-containing protein, partial [Acidobacteriota bacterium]|nr:SBBP repeat-containing protein [Acidobacteriota bacterium]
GVYKGVDLTYYGNQRQLEYDFRIQPGTDPGRIALGFEGADKIAVEGDGDLVLSIAGREVRQRKPFAYQEVNGAKQEVASRYVLAADNQVKFELGAYDATRPLVIDPVLAYSTYFGGTGNETSVGVAVNGAGEAYITGNTSSVNFPGSAVQGAAPNLSDVFVLKLNAAGTAVVYASYFGGDNVDLAGGIAVDSTGSAYVAGTTNSFNFPTAGTPYQAAKSGGNPLFKSADGGSNFGGGVVSGNSTGLTTANVSSIAVHPTNPSIVYAASFTGEALYKSTDGGATWAKSDAGVSDTFINEVAFSRTNSSNMYLTGCGSAASGASGLWRSTDSGATWQLTSIQGACMDTVLSDAAGVIYAGGYDGKGLWKSLDSGATWTNYVIGDLEADGTVDGFGFVVTNIVVDPTNAQVIYAGTDGGGVWKSLDGGSTWGPTTLNTPGTVGDNSMAIDPASTQTVYAVLAGQLFKTTDGGATWNGVGTPIQPGNYPTAVLLQAGTFYLGTSRTGVIKSTDGGATWSNTSLTLQNIHDLQVAPSDPNQIYAAALSSSDAFVTKLSADGSSLVYSTYLGGSAPSGQFTSDENATGIAVDANGNAYITGWTSSTDFPTQNPTQAFNGAVDAFVTKLNPSGSSLLFSTPIGGTVNALGRAIALAPDGSIYVAGNTNESDFPTVNAAQPGSGGGSDGFLLRLNPSGAAYAVGFSTYIGGAGNEQALGVATDANSNAYVAGRTNSGGLSTAGVVQPTRGGGNDGFAAKFTPAGGRAYLTYLGGNRQDFATSIAVDQSGNAYVAGYTN